ncbi:hypothetical protein PV11_02863 [Exophiala sideris]|uniref:Uncharacterized protein n=1 Tax=Exophiala sideris TaxID=1016849 RepID=A0A0D1ZKG9_9EURO|nr:hypothetical protein PV11_02863 [Exophiala sideris]
MEKLKSRLYSRLHKKDRGDTPVPAVATNASSISPAKITKTKVSASPALETQNVSTIPIRQRAPSPTSLRSLHSDLAPAQNNASPSTAGAAAKPQSRNLWGEAWLKLEIDQPDLHDKFASILAAEAPIAASAPAKLNEAFLRHLIDEKLATIQQKQWTLNLGSRSIRARAIVERCLGFITVSKDLLTQAAALDPAHAGLPVAALCLAVSLLTRDKEQNEALVDALETTAIIVQRYVATEQVYVYHNEDPNERLVECIVSLYSKILLLEAKLVIHLSANTGLRIAQNMTGQTDWLSVSKSVQQADEECERLRAIADSASATDHHRELREMLKDLNRKTLDFWRDYRREQQQYYLSDRARACMTLLRTTDYEDYKNRNPEPISGTCQWFKANTSFQNWLEKPGDSCLWVTADPGCGKSVLSKHLVDDYLAQDAGPDTTICYYFFKNEGIASIATNAICSLLHQIFCNERTKVLMHHIESDYQNNGDKLAGLFDRLWSVFEAVVKDNCAGRIVCVLDALDECAPDDRRRLLEKFRRVAENDRSFRSLKLLITSRPHIADAIEPVLQNSVKVVRLTGEAGEVSEAISQEIRKVVEQKLEDFRLTREERGLQDDAHIKVREYILNRGKNRTYLWVSLVFRDLFDNVESPLLDLQAFFEQFPSTVEEQYEKILTGITDQRRTLALRLLELVIGAPEPVSAQHLYVRLRATEGIDDINLLKPLDTKPLHRYLRSLCGCFISITPHQNWYRKHDPENYKVHLIHESAREFLVEDQSRPTRQNTSFKWQGVISERDTYHTWAESCLCFILVAHRAHMTNADAAATTRKTDHDVLSQTSDDRMILSQTLSSRLAEFKGRLPHYSLPTWALLHLERSFEDWDSLWYEMSEVGARPPYQLKMSTLIPLFLRFCFEVSCEWMADLSRAGRKGLQCDGGKQFRYDFEWNGPHKPLFVAVLFDSAAVVAAILMKEPRLVNVIDIRRKLTPFAYALRMKSYNCLAYFCERNDVSVTTIDDWGQTPLHQTNTILSLPAMRYILSKGEVNVNVHDDKGETALMLACWTGTKSTERLRELLKSSSLDANLQNSEGNTALMLVCNQYDRKSRKVSTEMVRELLKLPSLDVNVQNSAGDTALIMACCPRTYDSGRASGEIVRELLKSPSLDVNIRDTEGSTALHWAAGAGPPRPSRPWSLTTGSMSAFRTTLARRL